MLFCITHNRDQPPLKSSLFQLQVFANIRSLKISKWEMCIQLFLDLKMLGLYLYTLRIGHKSGDMLSILNKLTLPKELQLL